jgi:tRNA(Ile)-lysidine synthase
MRSPEDALRAGLRDLPRPVRLLVAFSGGLDSTVLLHLCAALPADAGVTLAAAHVDHGLHPDAEAWAAHCRAACRRLGVPLTVLRVDAAAARAEKGMEAAAREARYAALAPLLETGDCLLTAHHRDDQAETVLLQLLRGSGPAGLAAMPAIAALGAGLHLRPLLGIARGALLRYAHTHGLSWLDDPSNADPALGRGWLRGELLPRLRSRWPGADAALVRVARHCADAAAIVDECAAQDLAAVATASPWQLQAGALGRLPLPRRRAALRHWCARQGVPVPDTARLDALLAQLASAAAERAPQVEWPGGALRRHRDRLYLDPGLAPPPGGCALPLGPAGLVLPSGLGTLALVPGGALHPRLRDVRLELRFRVPGLRVAIAGRRGHHTLKNLFQEGGVPPWLRERVPILHADGEPAAIGDRWISAPFLAPVDDVGLALRWQRPAALAYWHDAPAHGSGPVTV